MLQDSRYRIQRYDAIPRVRILCFAAMDEHSVAIRRY